MAEKKQAVMVLREDGATASAVAPTSAATTSFFVGPKSGQTMEGGGAHGALEANGEAAAATKASLGFVAASPHAVTSILSPDLVSNHHPENLPPEATSKGITVTLDNNNMWNEFFRCKTEMILTKQGRRMFPTCRYRLSGMEPFQRYLLVMDIIPMDNHRYRWTDHRWEPNGKSEAHVTGRVFIHQDSPAAGHYWMGNPVSFYKLKLTNTVTDTDGHIVLHSMHRYLPRLHIVPADKPTDVIDIDSPDVMTFSFPQTEFFAVTAYLNLSITQLKIDYNPFAKGFREDATNSRSVVPKLGSPSTSAGSGGKNSLSPINSLKALFAKKVPVEKNKEDDPTRKQRDVDGKEGNAQLSATTDKSTVKRRPSTLSELFQGTPLKLRKTAPESGARKTAPESAGPRIILHKIDGGCANARSTLGSKKELAVQNPTLLKSVVNLTRLKSVESSIQSKPVENPTLLKSAAKDSFPLNGKSNEDFGSTSTSADAMTGDCSVTKGKNGEKVLNASSEENTGTDTRVGDSEKQSQSKSASQKLPSAKALPLLALFFQQLKSKSKPVKAAPKPDVTGSDAANEERSSPTTNVALAPSSTQHTESCTEPGDTHTSTLTPVSANKTVENTALEAPSELRIPPQMSESVSETLPKMQTSLQSPPTHTSPQSTTAVFPKLDMSLTATNPDEANPQAMTTSASGDPVDFVDQPVPDAPLSPLSPLSPSEFAVAFSPPSSPDFWPCSPLPVFTPEPLDPPANQKALLDPSANHNPLLDPPANHNLFDPPANHNPLLDPPANHNPLLDPPASRSLLPDPPSITSDIPPMSDPEDEDGDADGDRDADGDTNSGTGDITTGIGGTGVASLVINANNQLSAAGKAKARSRKKGRRNKQVEEEPVVGGPTDVRMQPNLEDVEGQLFVSFTSKEALSIHLSDQSEEAQPPSQKSPDVVEAKVVESPESTAERIASLEKALLQDLKVMKYKQVIHPVLQEVGLKLNILDQILAIDLVYLGVELPIPPASQSLVSSSQPPFISRTGKTTDVTKIKGWRDKFVTTDSQESQPEAAGPSSDATMTAASTSSTDAASSAMKNRSAFCSDMLDEYLANEGKLIDERAASFSTSSVTPVAYQMPTKSSSYVRTLDSVLKKRAPPSVPFSYNSSSSSFTTTTTTTMSGSRKTPASKQSTSATQNKKSKAPSKPKETQKLSSGGGGRKSSRTTTPKETSSTTSSTTSTTKAATKSSTSLETPKSISSSLLTKTSAPKLKNSTKTITPAVVKPPAPETTSSAKDSPKVESRAVVNRVPPVVKLLEVEDGAVWEGQERTYVTEERASIALAALATATGFNAPTLPIIVRRAPPCLQAHCRLGCVCTSLALERRHHHCGKPECMLGCHCLRHKVVLRRKSEGDKEVKEEPKSPVVVEIVTESEEGSIKSLKKKKKKKKRRKSLAYVVTDPQVTSEPATRVQTLWNGQGVDTDKDMLCIPTPAPALPCPIPYGLNDMYGLHDESMTCARIRPFENKASEETQQKDVSMQSIEDVSLEPETEIRLESETHDSEEGSEQYESGQVNEPEPGELTHGPSKRLEVVSDCKWERRSDCAYIMRMLCQHMDKDRLKTPFWIGKYRIQPLSQTVVDEGQGPCTNYKVHISMPQLVKGKIHTAPDSNKLSPAPTPTLSLTLTPSLTSTPSLMPEPPAAMAETTPEESRTASLQEAQPEPKPKPKPKPKGSLAPLKPVELLPPLRPEEGLPFLAGVPEAGTLVAKEPDEKGCGVMVNGKAYPKARLQLGHMGALHPANRLAAYLTGRLDPANLPGYTKSRLQVASTPPPPGPPTTTSSIAVVTVVNTAATSTTKTTVASSGVKGAYVRLPTPHNAGLPPTQKDGSSSSISTPGGAPVPATPVSSSSVTAPSGETPCITTTSAGIGTTTTTTSTATTSSPTTCTSTVQSKMVKIVPIRGSAAFNINTGSQALKEAPEFLGEPGTHTMTIFPKSRSVPGQSTQGASKGFTLLQPPGASAAKELEVLSKPSPSVVSASSEVDEKSAVTDASDTPKATSMQDEEPSSSDAEFSDEDSYLSSPSSPSKDAPPEDKTAEGNAHQSSTAGGEISIVDSSLDVTPMSPDICEVEIGGDDDDDGDDNDDEDDDECVIVSKKSAVIEAGEISSDVEIVGDLVVLSDDSDSDSDVESINVISDSGDTELSDDDSVDIETVDDSAASFRQMHKQNRGTGRTGMGSVTHCYNERMRRNAMRDSFAKLHLLLNIDDPKAARVRIILEATKAIRQLEGQERSLQIEKEALEKKQKEYVSRIAKASGKSPEVILEKLHDISSRQKKVEQQRKRKQLFTELAEKLTVRPPVSNRDTPPPAAATIRTPIPTRARSPSVVTPILSSASSRTSSAFSSRSSSPASRSHSPVPSRSPSPVHTDSPGRLTQTRSPVRSCSPSSPRTLSPVRAHSPMAATRTPLVATATEPVNAESRASRPPLRTYRPAQTQRNPTAVPPPEKRMRVMPNILSKKAKVPEPTPPKVTTTPTPTPLRLNTQVFSIISPMLQGQKIVSLDKPVGTLVKPVGTLVPVPIVPLSTLTTHKSMTPGVAAVTIRVPAGQQVVQVAGSQLRKPETQGSVQPPKEAKAAGNNVGLPKIMNVMSLVAPVNQVLHPTTKAPPVVPKVFPKAAQIRVLNDVLPRVTNAVQAQVINALPHWLRGALPPRVPDTVPSQVTNTPVPQVPGTVPSDVANEVTVSSDPATSTPQGAPESPGMDTLEDMAEADGPLDFVRKFAANLAASVELEGVEAEEQKGDEGAEGKERKEEGEGGGKEREQQEEGGEEAKEDATQEERGGGGEGEEGGGEEDDNTLMSLLNEIAFLNQQSSSDCPAQACTPSYTRPPEPGEVLGNRPARLDEERSPSPLVLRLDYDGDHTPSTTSTSTPLTKPITTDAPGTPVTNNSGGHSFTETPMKAAAASVSGSTPPLTPAPLLSSATNGQPEAAGAGNGESLTPPPLLQMKTGHVAPPVMPTFRPMPKLVPLGLKGTPQTPAGRESGSPP
ncbi:MAX dimerization protein MGA a isoform X5 [Engraulis encrasicolus]|uniref:MAX dimerization protein MGA a isoform X5 n=1 Tax=Engraulis encrasicolus TaxID=184585 RepID=UPI002FD38302